MELVTEEHIKSFQEDLEKMRGNSMKVGELKKILNNFDDNFTVMYTPTMKLYIMEIKKIVCDNETHTAVLYKGELAVLDKGETKGETAVLYKGEIDLSKSFFSD
jgi:hypothetical protein